MSVTPELVEKDDGGRLIKKIVALEAILAAPGEMITDEQGREFIPPPSAVAERDKSERSRLAICTDWSNHSTAWLMRHRLGLRAVLMDLMAGVEIEGDEAMIQALADFSKRNASHVKGILNLTIPLSESALWILGQYLWQLGLSTESRRPLEDGQRVRYYRGGSTQQQVILDRFITEGKIGARSPIELFIASHADLSQSDRNLLNSWHRSFIGLFAITQILPDGLELMNWLTAKRYIVLTVKNYIVKSNSPEKQPATSRFKPGDILLTRIFPFTDNEWIFSGSHTFMGKLGKPKLAVAIGNFKDNYRIPI